MDRLPRQPAASQRVCMLGSIYHHVDIHFLESCFVYDLPCLNSLFPTAVEIPIVGVCRNVAVCEAEVSQPFANRAPLIEILSSLIEEGVAKPRTAIGQSVEQPLGKSDILQIFDRLCLVEPRMGMVRNEVAGFSIMPNPFPPIRDLFEILRGGEKSDLDVGIGKTRNQHVGTIPVTLRARRQRRIVQRNSYQAIRCLSGACAGYRFGRAALAREYDQPENNSDVLFEFHWRSSKIGARR